MNGLRIRQNYGRVQLIGNGRVLTEMPWQAAEQVATALRSVARKAEEWAKAEEIAADQAVLMRAGAPIGLTDHPLIKKEATRLAQHDRDLRRFLPGGVKSEECVGTPKVIQLPRGKQP